MGIGPFLGVVLHAIGGFAAGTFYLPFKGVKKWAWESYWLVGGFFSWIIAPWVAVLLIAPDFWQIFQESPADSLWKTYLFGVLWGIGGLTFGLSMRYLGLSLGYALALGFCAAFGTVIPPVFKGEFIQLIGKTSGQVTMGGVLVCLAGIAVCGMAGVWKERDLPAEDKTATIKEFNFVKGFWVAVFAGVMSACMAIAYATGEPISKVAIKHEVPALWADIPLLVVVLAGGFTTNFLWCAYLNIKNKTRGDYLSGGAQGVLNYALSALAGVTWYFQFFFYSMGKSKMGDYDFSSWSIHMAFIIVFSNLWGILFREWRGVRPKTMKLIWTGIGILILSTLVIGLGNYLKGLEPA